MNVSYMLELMGTLGVGEGANVVPEDVYLQYLNLANLELYSETANFNDDVLDEYNFTTVAGQNYFDLPYTPHIISDFIVNGQKNPLIHKSRSVYKLYQFENSTAQTNPYIYMRKNNTLYFYPFKNNNIYTGTVFFAPPPTVLTAQTQEDEIPYPITYQYVLVNRALCILFAGEGGLRNSENNKMAKEKDQKGTTKLISYLQGSNIHEISTFRNA